MWKEWSFELLIGKLEIRDSFDPSEMIVQSTGCLSNSIILSYNFQRRSKNMKLSESLLTETTKQSQLKISLQPNVTSGKSRPLTIFTERNGKIHRLQLTLRSMSIAQLIQEAIIQFNLDSEVKLKIDAAAYLLFAARKSGKLCSDYPALEPTQNIILTKLTYYYLKDKATYISQARIKSNYVSERKEEIKAKERSFCNCLFGLRN